MVYYTSTRERAAESETGTKKIQKNLKKVLDKANQPSYNEQAVAEKDEAKSTLKIEQCKNKAYAK